MEQFPINKVLEDHAKTVTHIMESGEYFDIAALPSMALPRSLSFRKIAYSHVSVERFLTDTHHSRIAHPEMLVPFRPALSLMLQTEPAAERGLVARIDFATFGLSPLHLADEEFAVGFLLKPKAFSLYSGQHFSKEGEWIAGGPLKSTMEASPAGRTVAEVIHITDEVIQGLGYQALSWRSEF